MVNICCEKNRSPAICRESGCFHSTYSHIFHKIVLCLCGFQSDISGAALLRVIEVLKHRISRRIRVFGADGFDYSAVVFEQLIMVFTGEVDSPPNALLESNLDLNQALKER